MSWVRTEVFEFTFRDAWVACQTWRATTQLEFTSLLQGLITPATPPQPGRLTSVSSSRLRMRIGMGILREQLLKRPSHHV